MSDQIREQVSAFLDGELPNSETELLLKRLTRDEQLRECFGRYALIGESLRGASHARLSQGFRARVNSAIDGEPLSPGSSVARVHSAWWRPLAGAAVAAGVATVAVVALQQRAISPALRAALPAIAQSAASVQNAVGPHALADARTVAMTAPAKLTEALSYTVPAAVPDAPAGLPAARLTNYVFAHSKYSAVMGQNDVLNDLLSAADAEDAAPTDRSRDDRSAP